MKFQLMENVLDGFYLRREMYYIYKNPTVKELNSKEDTKWNRGIIDNQGNLYIEAKYCEDKKNTEEFSYITHNILLDELQSRGLFNNLNSDSSWSDVNLKDISDSIFVTRFGDTFDFYLSESYVDEDVLDEEKVKTIFKLAKKKNPKLNFINEVVGKYSKNSMKILLNL